MCGIVGIIKKSNGVAVDLYESLLMLQHRGQDAAGIVTGNGLFFREKKDNGLVKDVFHQDDMIALDGFIGMGHVRYPTSGTLNASEAQPFFVNAPYGIYLIHNGNLTNADLLREKVMKKYRRHLRTKSDSEVLLNVFADKIHQQLKDESDINDIDRIFEAVKMTMKDLEGAYSVLCLIDEVGLLAFRDPHGIRPLCMGKRSTSRGNEWAFASENVAFSPIQFEKVRDVIPGEAIIVTHDGTVHQRQCAKGQLNPCIFEYVYLARPDSILDGISVYKTQLRLGQTLAKQIKKANLKIDSIVPVPDSSRPVALEISKELGIKYREGLVKNRYVGRTFIMPGQEIREKSVRRKLNIIGLEFRNRNVLLVDDSIVRGTTMRQIIEMCRQAGAKKIYVASAAPPVIFPNVYGVDMPTRRELVANQLDTEEVQKILGADALFYQKLEDLIWAAREGNPEIETFEDSCFSGNYVTKDITEKYLADLEIRQERIDEEPISLPNI